ncbi:MAG: gluconate 2-dehydrogenase subunit 3 family protein [Actinocrinis sp.]
MAHLDATPQWRHWDPATAGAVIKRLGPAPPIRYFTAQEQATATALCDRLLDLEPDSEVPVVAAIDSRLAEAETDGWRYADMPEDGSAWRASLAGLKADAVDRFQSPFADIDPASQNAIIEAVRAVGTEPWHGLPAGHLWSLWTRYACTAFFGHPFAWSEIGFPGPAYPRGYKNLGIDARDPHEQAGK